MAFEFHARSAFSFLEGASLPEAMVARASELGYQGIAITDRDGFYGSARAHQVAKGAGITAFVGCTIPHGDGVVPILCRTRERYGEPTVWACFQILSTQLQQADENSGGLRILG